MSTLKHVSVFNWVRSFMILLIIGLLLPTSSAFAKAPVQAQGPEIFAKEAPADGERNQLVFSNPNAMGDESIIPLTTGNLLQDPSFEASFATYPYWSQFSTNRGTPLCTTGYCGTGGGTAGPRTGSVWSWFGGVYFGDPGVVSPEIGYVYQNVTFPSCGATLQFYLWIGYAQAGSGADDVFSAKVDGVTVFSANATQKNSYPSYKLVSINVNSFANGAVRTLEFYSNTTGQIVNFNLDDVSLKGTCPTISGNAGVAGAALNYTGGATSADGSGNYSFNVPPGWSGTVTPSKTGYIFSPVNRTYSNVVADQTGQNYTATALYSISGNAGVAGATVNYTGGSTSADGSGNYSFIVPSGWSGTVTPSKTGYIFSPVNRTYSNVVADQTAQNYTAIPLYSISGNAGVAGATLSYTEGTPKTTTSQSNGSYSLTVPSNWSSTVTPTHPCFTFSPTSRSYSNVTANQISQNYTPTLIPGSGCADINVSIGGANQGRFGVPSPGSTRASFAGLNNGPVKIASTNAISIIGAERVIYTVNGVPTSFSEMMGLPDSQLNSTYWLPWYNNVDLSTQLRFGNVSGTDAHVNVTIGGALMTGSPFTLVPGESTRVTFDGVNNGPVQIDSDVNIVAAERVIYTVNGTPTSFSEMMALPDSQLDTTYWMPWYNNVNLSTQLRFGNVSGTDAHVNVTIGGTLMTGSPFTLVPGESTRVTFDGVDNGPVKIDSDVNIVAAERVIYNVNGIPTSFSEMMGLPDNQLNIIYWMPWYNNVDLSTQLRFGNVSGTDAHVNVTIGGTLMTGSPFTLIPGESTRVSFAGVNNGPVKIESDVNIVAAERVIYTVNGTPTSFSEMMGLPNNLLNAIYWLPWYNNVDLDTQLRFGVP